MQGTYLSIAQFSLFSFQPPDTESKMEIENREEEAGLVTKHAGFQYGLSPFAIKI